MSALTAQQLDEVRRICEGFGVDRLDLFGSAAGGDFEPARSDYDFVVRFAPCTPSEHYDRYFGLLESLEQLLEAKVDLVEEIALRNPHLIRRMNESRIQLYAA